MPRSHPPSSPTAPQCPILDRIIQNNRTWAATKVAGQPDYFEGLLNQQTPEFLWIGCADSRVPANTILGLNPGEVFVQRNVGNQASHTDMNVMACMEYAVNVLKVKTIICCGHYGCGAVKGALTLPARAPGLVNCWISDIRECRNQNYEELMGMSPEEQLDRLCELNVVRQTLHICTSPVVQNAWENGAELAVFGMVYNLKDGLIKRLAGPLTKDNNSIVKYEASLLQQQEAALGGGGRSCVQGVEMGEAAPPRAAEVHGGLELLVDTLNISETSKINTQPQSSPMAIAAAPSSPEKLRQGSSFTSSSARDGPASPSSSMVRQGSFTNDIAKSLAQHVNWSEPPPL